jgi:hypothetical protein
LVLSSPDRRIPKQAAQQTDLPGVQHLVVCAPQQRPQLRRRIRVRVRHGPGGQLFFFTGDLTGRSSLSRVAPSRWAIRTSGLLDDYHTEPGFDRSSRFRFAPGCRRRWGMG